MAPTSAAMELKVLISVLQNGGALNTLLQQTNQLSAALAKLQAQANAAGGLGGVSQGANNAAAAIAGVGNAGRSAATGLESLDRTMNKLANTARFVMGGFLALQSVRFIKGLADEAARVEVLGTVLNVVGQNAGKTAEEIEAADKAVQKLGITAESSRKSLTQFLQAGLKLDFAPKLARAAQDLAVIAGKNSSDTFARMIVNIQQLDTLGLRWMGIIVDRTQAEQKYKALHVEITGALNKRQMQEALMLEVLEKAKLLEGTYSSAMGDVGKQVQSLSRFTETYRVVLGESLLPAYSAIVVEVTKTFEKLIILGREFTANKERAQAWADAAKSFAETMSALVITVAEHLDQIVTLLRWYMEFKAVMWGLAAAAAAWTWVLGVVQWLTRLRVAITAVQMGIVGYTGAVKIMQAATLEGAIAVAVLAKEQQALALASGVAATGVERVGMAATLAAIGVRGLTAAWVTMAALFAVPLIGYVVYRTIKDEQEESKKPFMEQAANARRNQGMIVGDTVTETRHEQLFKLWKTNHPEMVMMLKTETELWKEYNRQIDQQDAKTVMTGIDTKIAEARKEQEDAIAAKQRLDDEAKSGRAVTFGEKQVATDRITKATDALKALRVEMDKTVEAMSFSTEGKAIFAQIDKVADLEAKVSSIRRDKSLSPAPLRLAEAELEIEKKKKEEMLAQHEAKQKTAVGADKETIARDLAAARYKEDIGKKSLQGEDLLKAQQDMFGDQVFTDKGVVSGRFNKVFGGFQTLIQESEKIMAEEGEVPFQLAEQIRKGLTEVGKAAQTPVDLSKLRGILADVGKLGVPGARAASQQAVALAQIGVRQAELAVNAPIVAEERDRIQQRSAIRQQEAQEHLDLIRTRGQFEKEALDKDQTLNLASLGDYFRKRRVIVQRDGEEELRLQGEKITEATELRAMLERFSPTDKKAIAAAERQEEAAHLQYVNLQRKTELELWQLMNQEEAQVLKLQKELRANEASLAATYGGQKEAIDQLNQSLETEYEKNTKLEGVERTRADHVTRLKQIAGEYDIIAKFRERAYQIEVKSLQLAEAYLNTQQRVVNVERAQLDRKVSRGEVTDLRAMAMRNGFIREEMDIARANILVKQRELEMLEKRNQAELEGEKRKLDETSATPENRALRLAELTRDQQLAVADVTSALYEQEEAYERLGASVETYADTIRKSLTDALSQVMEDALFDAENMFKNLEQLGKSLGRQLMAPLIKSTAQLTLKGVTDLFTKDKKETKPGEKPEGQSRLGTIMDTLFGGAKRDGSSPDKAMWMQLVGGTGPPPTLNAKLTMDGSLLQQLIKGSGTAMNAAGGNSNLGQLIGLGLNFLGNINFGAKTPVSKGIAGNPMYAATGGPVRGPGTGTSDSIPAMVSAGEHIMPADKAARWMPVLEGIRMGTILPQFALGGVVALQSIANPSVIPRRYASGGVVVADAGAPSVQTGGGVGNMTVALHPDALHMTLREWLEQEVVRQQGRR